MRKKEENTNFSGTCFLLLNTYTTVQVNVLKGCVTGDFCHATFEQKKYWGFSITCQLQTHPQDPAVDQGCAGAALRRLAQHQRLLRAGDQGGDVRVDGQGLHRRREGDGQDARLAVRQGPGRCLRR